MSIFAVGMLMHMRCNAECKHCCFESSPRRTEAMTEDEMLAYVDSIARLPTAKQVYLTGGEPFLRRDLLRKVTERAHAQGLATVINTNAYWALDAARAHAALEPLANAGLEWIVISADDFHEEFMPRSRLANALKAAVDLGVRVQFNVVGAKCSFDEAARVLEDIDLPVATWIGTGKVMLCPAGTVPAGAALLNVDAAAYDMVHVDSPDNERLRIPCPYVLRNTIITPSADLAVCCSPATATPTGFRKEFVAGNLRDQPLDAVIESAEGDGVFQALSTEGPLALYELVRKEDPGALERDSFVNICDLCAHVVTSPRAQAVFARCFKRTAGATTTLPHPIPAVEMPQTTAST